MRIEAQLLVPIFHLLGERSEATWVVGLQLIYVTINVVRD